MRRALIALAVVFSGCAAEDGPRNAGDAGHTGAAAGTTGHTGGSASAGTVGSPGGTAGSVGGTMGVSTGGSLAAGSGGSSAGGSAGGSGGVTTGGASGTGAGGSSPSGDGGRGGAAGAAGAVSAGGRGGRAGGGGQAGGTAGVAGGRGGTGPGSAGSGGSPLAPVTDYSAVGPFATTTERNVGPNQGYTIFRPQTLGANGFLHAPIIFGPGINMQATQLSGLLTRFASHGFVVISVNVLTGGPNDAGNRTKMLDGLNWIIQQNSQAGAYQGKLDVTHAVSMGYSVGGTAAVEIGGHAAVATTVSIHGHIATAALHGPMLQTSGTGDTVGLPMQQKTYDMSQVQTFLATVMGADHGYIQTTVNGVPGGVEEAAIVAWMRYWIYNDAGGRRFFYGNDCVMCTSPWVNPQRKNWQ